MSTSQTTAQTLKKWQDRAYEAEASRDRWREHALAWEGYDLAFTLGTDKEFERAKEILDATYGQLHEFGDLPHDR